MRADQFLVFFSILQIAMCVAVVTAMLVRRVVGKFPSLVGLVTVLALAQTIRISILFYRRPLGIEKHVAYRALFLSEWLAQLLEMCLLVLIIYGLFSEAMRPFPGLHRIGRIIFRWVGAVSLLVALALSAGPELFVRSASLIAVYNEVAPRFQQGISVLILCSTDLYLLLDTATRTHFP